MHHPTVTWLLASLVTKLLVRARVRDESGVLRQSNAPAVVVCNHRSWIDPMVIISACGPRRPVVFLAAREHVLRRHFIHRLLAWSGAVILVDRTSARQRDVLRAAEAVVAAGGTLALFPEGKINDGSTGEAVLPLEPGAAVIARRSDAPILPLAIAGTSELYFRRQVILQVGVPFSPERSHRRDDATTDRIREALLSLLPPTPKTGRWQPGRWLARLA